MKKIYFALMGTLSLIFLAAPQLDAQVVVIDPGHGYDCSGNNVDGRTTTEIYTALAVGQKLQTLISSNNCGWTVHLTRTTNGSCGWTSVTQRATMSNNWNATRFISIHCNAGGGTGTETFYCNQSASSTALDQAFGQKVQDNMVVEGQWNDRRMVEDRSYLPYHLGVLRTNNAPACLSEIGFVDYSSDAAKLNSDSWRDKFALAYFKALQSELGTCSGGGSANLAPDGSIYYYTSQLSSSYAASKAIDQTVSTRWNSDGSASTNYIMVQLDGMYDINKFTVKHASNAGLSSNLNTERFYLMYWTGSAWANAVSNYYNSTKAATTNHNVNVTAQYVCLYITDPTFTSDIYSRIPEFEVYGSAAKRALPQQSPPPYAIFGDVALETSSLRAVPSVVTEGRVSFVTDMEQATEGILEVLDMDGRVVKALPSRVYPQGQSQVEMIVSDLAAGVYLYRLRNYTGVGANGKLVVQ